MKLIGLTGKARSGKDSVAEIFCRYADYRRVAFADALKEGAAAIFGLTPDWMLDGMKEQVHPYWGMSPRRMYQLLGTEAVRETFEQDHWIRRAFMEVERVFHDGYDGVVFSDVRFANEAEAIKNQGGSIIRIVRPDIESALHLAAARHISESPIPDDLIDFTILNNRTKEDLTNDALDMLDVIEFGARQ